MHVLSQIDAVATQAQNRQVQLQQALAGLLAMAMDSREPLSSQNQSWFFQATNAAFEQSYFDLLKIVGATGDKLTAQAVADAGGRGGLDPKDIFVVSMMYDESYAGLEDAMNGDRIAVRKAFRSFLYDLTTRQIAGIPTPQARFEAQQGKVAALKFVRRDRAGKRWETSLYSRTVTRALLLKIYVETYLLTLVNRGIDVAMVWYPNAIGHADHGKTFSITGKTPDLPTYDQIADEIWHPNSTALVSH